MKAFRGGMVAAAHVAVIDHNGKVEFADVFNTGTVPSIAPSDIGVEGGYEFLHLALIKCFKSGGAVGGLRA